MSDKKNNIEYLKKLKAQYERRTKELELQEIDARRRLEVLQCSAAPTVVRVVRDDPISSGCRHSPSRIITYSNCPPKVSTISFGHSRYHCQQPHVVYDCDSHPNRRPITVEDDYCPRHTSRGYDRVCPYQEEPVRPCTAPTGETSRSGPSRNSYESFESLDSCDLATLTTLKQLVQWERDTKRRIAMLDQVEGVIVASLTGQPPPAKENQRSMVSSSGRNAPSSIDPEIQSDVEKMKDLVDNLALKIKKTEPVAGEAAAPTEPSANTDGTILAEIVSPQADVAGEADKGGDEAVKIEEVLEDGVEKVATTKHNVHLVAEHLNICEVCPTEEFEKINQDLEDIIKIFHNKHDETAPADTTPVAAIETAAIGAEGGEVVYPAGEDQSNMSVYEDAVQESGEPDMVIIKENEQSNQKMKAALDGEYPFPSAEGLEDCICSGPCQCDSFDTSSQCTGPVSAEGISQEPPAEPAEGPVEEPVGEPAAQPDCICTEEPCPCDLSDPTESSQCIEPLAEEPLPVEPVEEPLPVEPVEEPIVESPAEEPVDESPPEEPVEEPLVEEPVEEPLVEEPKEEPPPEGPPAEELAAEEPVAEEPPAEQPDIKPAFNCCAKCKCVLDDEPPPPEEPKAEPPADEPIEEPPVEEPAVELSAEEPIEEPPAEEPIVEPPAEEPIEEPAEEPIEEPAVEPVDEPPAEEPIEEPAVEPVEEPPAEEPLEEPAVEPVEEPLAEEPAVEELPPEEPVEDIPTEEPVDEPPVEEELVEEVVEELPVVESDGAVARGELVEEPVPTGGESVGCQTDMSFMTDCRVSVTAICVTSVSNCADIAETGDRVERVCQCGQGEAARAETAVAEPVEELVEEEPPVEEVAPVVEEEPPAEEAAVEEELVAEEEPLFEEAMEEPPAEDAAEEPPAEEAVEEPPAEEPAEEVVEEELPAEEPTEEVFEEEVPAEEPIEEVVEEELPVEETAEEPPAEEAVEEPLFEEPLDEVFEEELPAEDAVEEPPVEEAVEEPLAEEPFEEVFEEELPAEDAVEEPPADEAVEEPPAEEVVEELPAEEPTEEAVEPPAEEAVEELPPDEPADEGVVEEPPTEEPPAEEPAELPVVASKSASVKSSPRQSKKGSKDDGSKDGTGSPKKLCRCKKQKQKQKLESSSYIG